MIVCLAILIDFEARIEQSKIRGNPNNIPVPSALQP